MLLEISNLRNSVIRDVRKEEMVAQSSKSSNASTPRRSGRMRTPTKLHNIEHQVSLPLAISTTKKPPKKKVRRPSSAKRTSLETPMTNISSVMTLPFLSLYDLLQKPKFNASKTVSSLFTNRFNGNEISVISLSFNLLLRAAGIKINCIGRMNNKDILNVRDILEEVCEEEEIPKKDLDLHLFSSKIRKDKELGSDIENIRSNFKDFYKYLAKYLLERKDLASLFKVFIKNLGQLLEFGIFSIRYLSLITSFQVIYSSIEFITSQRRNIFNKVSLLDVDIDISNVFSSLGFVNSKSKEVLQLDSKNKDKMYTQVSELVLRHIKINEEVEAFLTILITKRWKDINDQVRVLLMKCLRELSVEYLTASKYLKYIGWNLNDQNPDVRLLSVQILKNFLLLTVPDDTEKSKLNERKQIKVEIYNRYKVKLLTMINDVEFKISIEVTKLLQILEFQDKLSESELFLVHSFLFLPSPATGHSSEDERTACDYFSNTQSSRDFYEMTMKHKATLNRLHHDEKNDFLFKSEIIQNLLQVSNSEDASKGDGLNRICKFLVLQLGTSNEAERERYVSVLKDQHFEFSKEEDFNQKQTMLSIEYVQNKIHNFVLLLLKVLSAESKEKGRRNGRKRGKRVSQELENENGERVIKLSSVFDLSFENWLKLLTTTEESHIQVVLCSLILSLVTIYTSTFVSSNGDHDEEDARDEESERLRKVVDILEEELYNFIDDLKTNLAFILNKINSNHFCLTKLIKSVQLLDYTLETNTLSNLLLFHSDEKLIQLLTNNISTKFIHSQTQTQQSAENENENEEVSEYFTKIYEFSTDCCQQILSLREGKSKERSERELEFDDKLEISLTINFYKVLCFLKRLYQRKHPKISATVKTRKRREYIQEEEGISSSICKHYLSKVDFSLFKKYVEEVILDYQSIESLKNIRSEDLQQTLISTRTLFLKYYLDICLFFRKLDITLLFKVFASSEKEEQEEERENDDLEEEFKDIAFKYVNFYFLYQSKTLANCFERTDEDVEEKEEGESMWRDIEFEKKDISQQQNTVLLAFIENRFSDLSLQVQELQSTRNESDKDNDNETTILLDHNDNEDKKLEEEKYLTEKYVDYFITNFITPLLKRLYFSNLNNKLNLKTISFLLQYSVTEYETLNNVILMFIFQLYNNPLLRPFLVEINFIALKLVYTIKKSDGEELDDNSKSESDKITEFYENLFRFWYSLDMDIYYQSLVKIITYSVEEREYLLFKYLTTVVKSLQIVLKKRTKIFTVDKTRNNRGLKKNELFDKIRIEYVKVIKETMSYEDKVEVYKEGDRNKLIQGFENELRVTIDLKSGDEFKRKSVGSSSARKSLLKSFHLEDSPLRKEEFGEELKNVFSDDEEKQGEEHADIQQTDLFQEEGQDQDEEDEVKADEFDSEVESVVEAEEENDKYEADEEEDQQEEDDFLGFRNKRKLSRNKR